METKDFVLLMLIPVMLISLVVYTDKSPLITGAVTAQEEKSNLIGNYSIMPSFKARIDYDLSSEYKKVKERLDGIIDECKSRQDIEDCLKGRADEFSWNCFDSDNAVDVFYEFVDRLNECIHIKEDKVVCRFALDKKDINQIKNLQIKLTNENKKVMAVLVKDKITLEREYINLENLLYTGYDNKDGIGKSANRVEIIISYQDKKPVVEQAYAIDGPNKIGLSRTFLFYKTKNNVKFIDELEENLFRFEKIIELPKIKGFKFCAKTGKQIYAYDKSDDTVKAREIVYRLAATYPKQSAPPKPVDGLKVFDAIKAENSAILVWDKSSDSNIKSYSIYHSTKDFADVKMGDIKKDQDIDKKYVSNNPVEIKDIDLRVCIFNPIDKPCKYLIHNQQLEKDKLYYLQAENKLIYLITDAKDGIGHYFAVTAVNNEGAELNNDKSIINNDYVLAFGKNYQKSVPKDDLAPGKVLNLQGQGIGQGKAKLAWAKPGKNIDGSAIADIAGFNAYYKKGQSASGLEKIDISYTKRLITATEANCDNTLKLSCEHIVEGLEQGQSHNFAVTAVDENSNEFKDNADVINIIVS